MAGQAHFHYTQTYRQNRHRLRNAVLLLAPPAAGICVGICSYNAKVERFISALNALERAYAGPEGTGQLQIKGGDVDLRRLDAFLEKTSISDTKKKLEDFIEGLRREREAAAQAREKEIARAGQELEDARAALESNSFIYEGVAAAGVAAAAIFAVLAARRMLRKKKQPKPERKRKVVQQGPSVPFAETMLAKPGKPEYFDELYGPLCRALRKQLRAHTAEVCEVLLIVLPRHDIDDILKYPTNLGYRVHGCCRQIHTMLIMRGIDPEAAFAHAEFNPFEKP